MSLGDLVKRIEPSGGGFVLHGADGWTQGRTMYGGASTLIAYAAARRAFADLPPLRGAQVGFVGPVGEDLDISVSMLRQGRNVSQVVTDMFCDGQIVHRCLWLFGSAREPNAKVEPQRVEGVLAVDTADEMPPPMDNLHFIRKLELRRAEGRGGSRPGTVRRWARFRERSGLDPIGELLGIGDALPPGSMRTMRRRGPISSINWSLTLLNDHPQTRDGWWLLETSSNFADDGFSSETLRCWNADGVEVMRGLQSVAIFG
ncbi:thioesterase family protein [Novosphingobium sp. ZN18A2]|uniref:thioesterase family protein n=1 Tax=Novosphingobium sp. ZN18A2 TaxID=3079861 RepID=UPI0030CDC1C7